MEAHQLSVAQAAAAIRDGALSPVELMDSLLAQVAAFEPRLSAWVTLDPDTARSAARQVEIELSRNGPRGPLHGVPVGLKDIFCTAGVPTTACSRLFADYVPAYDATCVARLKEAGAVMMGKLVTTAYAAGDPSPTVNPWDTDRTPGGSSSGSAVAVATRMCPAALGSQTVGSTLRPAAYAGIVGLKPTFGRISLHGVLPLGWSLDTVGILVRTVEDAALLLGVMAGHDPHDSVSAPEPVIDYLSGTARRDRPPRIGLLRGFFYEHADEAVRRHTDAVAQRLADAGAEVVEIADPSSFAAHAEATMTTFDVEVAATHEPHYRSDPTLYPPLIRAVIERGLATSAQTYAAAHQTRARFRQELRSVFDSVDILIGPSTPSQAPPTQGGTTGPPLFQGPWTSAGLPAISIPSGLDASGLPLGVQIAAPWFQEKGLIETARWCETVLGEGAAPPMVEQGGQG